MQQLTTFPLDYNSNHFFTSSTREIEIVLKGINRKELIGKYSTLLVSIKDGRYSDVYAYAIDSVNNNAVYTKLN